MHYDALTAKGITRSPIMSCTIRIITLLLCLLKIASARKGVMEVHSAGKV